MNIYEHYYWKMYIKHIVLKALLKLVSINYVLLIPVENINPYKIIHPNLDESSPQSHVFVYFSMLNRWKDCSGSLMFCFLDRWRFLFTVWFLSHDSDVRFPGSMSKWKLKMISECILVQVGSEMLVCTPVAWFPPCRGLIVSFPWIVPVHTVGSLC